MNSKNKATPSQSFSTTEIDDAYDRLHTERNAMQERLDGTEVAIGIATDRIETLETEKDALTQALEGMLRLQKQSTTLDKEEYIKAHLSAYEAAEQVLSTLEA